MWKNAASFLGLRRKRVIAISSGNSASLTDNPEDEGAAL